MSPLVFSAPKFVPPTREDKDDFQRLLTALAVPVGIQVMSGLVEAIAEEDGDSTENPGLENMTKPIYEGLVDMVKFLFRCGATTPQCREVLLFSVGALYQTSMEKFTNTDLDEKNVLALKDTVNTIVDVVMRNRPVKSDPSMN